MVVTVDRFALLLQALGLSQGFFKPVPSVPAPPGIATNAINSTHTLEFPAVNESSNLRPHAGVPPLLLDTVNNFQTMKQHDTGMSCHVDPYDVPDIGDQTFAPFDQTEANIFRYRQQQSVNLGSW
jgi:glucan 1,3-beta-glucosidase